MKTSFFKHIKVVLGLALAIALPSCLQNETTITLNKDGSGTIVEESILSAEMLGMMTQFAQPGAPDPVAEMFSEEKAKKKAPKMGEGVEFVKSEMIDKDGKKGARTEYKFADINKLKISPGDAVSKLGDQVPDAEKKAKEESLKFAYADGVLKIITPPADFSDMRLPGQDEEGEKNPQMEEMMTKMMADMRITIKLRAADGIKETNATYAEGDTVTLFDVEVGKMFAQKDELKKISETAKTDKDAAKAAFGKLDGVKVESKEDVTVTLK